MGSVLIDDSQLTPQKCPFSEIDFLDVSDDFEQKKNVLKKKLEFFFNFSIFLLLEIEL